MVCPQVEWDTEKLCFETFARETADFYAVKAKWLLSTSTDDEPTQQVYSIYTPTRAAPWRMTTSLDSFVTAQYVESG